MFELLLVLLEAFHHLEDELIKMTSSITIVPEMSPGPGTCLVRSYFRWTSAKAASTFCRSSVACSFSAWVHHV